MHETAAISSPFSIDDCSLLSIKKSQNPFYLKFHALFIYMEGSSFQAGSMILVSEEKSSRPGASRRRRPGSAGPRLCGGGGGAESRGSSWDRSLHREDWKHGSIGKLDPKEGSESDLASWRRKKTRSQPGYSKSVLSSVDSIPHYAAHTAASSARISRSVDRYQGEMFLIYMLLSV